MITISELAMGVVIIRPQLERLLQLWNSLLILLHQAIRIADAEISFGIVGSDSRSANKSRERLLPVVFIERVSVAKRETHNSEVG